jgi:aspartate aminotransferase
LQHDYHTQGAFYVLPIVSHVFGKYTPKGLRIETCEDFTLHLLEDYLVALVPGAAFGADDTVRISYATDVPSLTKAMSQFCLCLANLVSK